MQGELQVQHSLKSEENQDFFLSFFSFLNYLKLKLEVHEDSSTMAQGRHIVKNASGDYCCYINI